MAGTHQRNVGPMMASRRCGAKTRSGRPCKSPAVQGKARCRMHGGAAGSGAPLGNTNALKHGKFSRERIERQRQLEILIESVRKRFFGRAVKDGEARLETDPEGTRPVARRTRRP